MKSPRGCRVSHTNNAVVLIASVVRETFKRNMLAFICFFVPWRCFTSQYTWDKARKKGKETVFVFPFITTQWGRGEKNTADFVSLPAVPLPPTTEVALDSPSVNRGCHRRDRHPSATVDVAGVGPPIVGDVGSTCRKSVPDVVGGTTHLYPHLVVHVAVHNRNIKSLQAIDRSCYEYISLHASAGRCEGRDEKGDEELESEHRQEEGAGLYCSPVCSRCVCVGVFEVRHEHAGHVN